MKPDAEDGYEIIQIGFFGKMEMILKRGDFFIHQGFILKRGPFTINGITDLAGGRMLIN